MRRSTRALPVLTVSWDLERMVKRCGRQEWQCGPMGADMGEENCYEMSKHATWSTWSTWSPIVSSRPQASSNRYPTGVDSVHSTPVVHIKLQLFDVQLAPGRSLSSAWHHLTGPLPLGHAPRTYSSNDGRNRPAKEHLNLWSFEHAGRRKRTPKLNSDNQKAAVETTERRVNIQNVSI